MTKMLGLNAMAAELKVTVTWLKKRAIDGLIPIEDTGSMRFLFDPDKVWARMAEISGYGRNGCSCAELVNATEAERRLHLDRTELVARAKAGLIPSFKYGDRYLFRLDVLMAIEFARRMEQSKKATSPKWRREVGLPLPETESETALSTMDSAGPEAQ